MSYIRAAALHLVCKYRDARLRTKMQLLFSAVLLLSILLTGIAYQQIYRAVSDRRVSEMSSGILSAIGSSMDTIIKMENSYSKIILSNSDVQKALRSPDGLLELSRARDVNIVLTGQLETNTMASAVYIIDNHGNRYGVDEQGLRPIGIINSDITSLPWYTEISQRHGGYILVKNGGGIFLEPPKEDFISLIRIINDLQNFDPIGILMINIPSSSFARECMPPDYSGESGIIVTDPDGIILLDELHGALGEGDNAQQVRQAIREGAEGSLSVDGVDYLLSRARLRSASLYITGLLPVGSIREETSIFGVITIAVLIVTGLLLFLGVLFLSRSITKPIDQLLRSMDTVEQGIFQRAEFPTGEDEIGRLKRRYNIMVERIGELFQKTIEDQQVKRRVELSLLQAQIKPHFLYNTLDSIRALSMTGDNRRVYYTVTALENYYRICLSNGKEIISMADEVKSVKNYLRIQRIRYGSLFRVIYSMDKELMGLPVPKLILQPLAENAIYHGLKPKGGGGIIHISVQRQDGGICIAVEDNGVGMEQERADALLLSEEHNGRFGLRGTAERLRIYYDGKGGMSVISIPGIGTRVELLIPVVEEGVAE